MLMNERREQILSILTRNKFVTVGRLCEILYASPATIRRDLAEMDEQGMLQRLRGGAELSEGSNSDMPLLLRFQKEKEKKEKIAALALRELEASSTVFMDSSSTVFYLARQLRDYAGKSVITNGLATANFLNEQTAAAVYCTGGRIFHRSGFVGGHAADAIQSYCADTLFFSCCGLSVKNGPTEAEEENAQVKRAMIRYAKRKILLCDSTKFAHDYFCRVCALETIDLIVTDKRPDGPIAEAILDKLVCG
jgi:Transcriptional regulators of sugar metabolism